MFESWAVLYDTIYRAKGKDYRAEAAWILEKLLGTGAGSAMTAGPSSAEVRTNPIPGVRSSSVPPQILTSHPVSLTPAVQPPCVDASVAPERWLKRSGAAGQRPRLLDVACGTGEHLLFLKEGFDVVGIDKSAAMLAVARAKLGSEVPLIEGDMTELGLGNGISVAMSMFAQPFDVVTCMFSSIGYLRSYTYLHDAVVFMSSVLAPGGTILIEPTVLPDRMKPPETSRLSFEHEGRTWLRTTSAEYRHPYLRIRFEYETEGEQFVDEQELRLFTLEEYAEAFRAAELTMEFDAQGPSGLGMLAGKRDSA